MPPFIVTLDRVVNGLAVAGEVASTIRRIQNGAGIVPRSPNGRRSLERYRADYARKHGGHDGWGRPPLVTTIPVPDEIDGEPYVQELGAITRIGYTTTKRGGTWDDGDPSALEEFIHDFGEEGDPRPILCWSSSGLLIARGRSPYVVTDHGIER